MSYTQQGVVTQYEFAKILIVTSDGMLEVSMPMTDDERRDMEIHIRGGFAASIAFQLKSTMHLAHRYKAYHLSMFFSVPKAKLVTHPNFWYSFGYFDRKTLGFADPLFIVPSEEVHTHAAPHLDGDRWNFNFTASLDPESNDRWRPNRVPTHDVGRRVLEIIQSQSAVAAATPLPAEVSELDGLIFVGQRPGRSS